MDYTNFVKIYYKNLIAKLDKFSKYNGSYANLNYGIELDNENYYAVDRHFIDILPNYDIVITAPLKCFEEFLEYYANLYPELRILFLGNEIVKFYELALSKGIINSEEKTVQFIDLMIDSSLELLKSSGVIE